LHRLNITSTALCIYNQKETTKHLLLECKAYKKERDFLFKQIKKGIQVRSLTLPLILHTKIGIKNLLVFLKETNICTKSWHLERESRIEELAEEI